MADSELIRQMELANAARMEACHLREALRELLRITGPDHSDMTSRGWAVRRAYDAARALLKASPATVTPGKEDAR